MQVVSIISTKGGGQDHDGGQPGGFAVDAGPRVLLLTWTQPTLSSYHAGRTRAGRHLRDAGLQRAARRATGVAHRDRGFDLVLSNDDRGELNTLLLHAPDGGLRLRHLLPRWRRATTCC